MTEIKNGTWLDWGGALRRAMGPPRRDADISRFELVEFCWPEEWEAGSAGEGYDYAPVHKVSALSDKEGKARQAERSARLASCDGRCSDGALHRCVS